ncbi:MAG: ATP-dependent DNA helicase Rep, partial [Acidobacteria bacterium]
MDLAKLLNPQQLEAVQTTEGPVLILAGAGSGKTRVITYRVTHLIENRGVRPEQILAVTFTNKAADQMKFRVRNLLRAPRSGDPLISTFHSLCVRILRREIGALNYTREFTIYDEADQLQVVKAAMKDLKVDERLVTPKTIQSRISYAKNHGKTAQNLLDDSWEPSWEYTANVFNEYEKRLRKSNALDFDDLLIKTVELFDKFPPAAEKYSTRFPYVMVDEYQDTNRQQYLLVRHLTRVHDNVCVVGDEDQSIYSWRGADIQNILSFEKDFPRVRIIKLEQN